GESGSRQQNRLVRPDQADQRAVKPASRRKQDHMIIQLDTTTAENLEAARRQLTALAHSWGQDMTPAPATRPQAAGAARNDARVIDPASVTALALSTPSAALAVLDLADRIHKRRRATELIDHAQQLAARYVTVRLMSHNRPVELTTLTPDQLLDLLADDN